MALDLAHKKIVIVNTFGIGDVLFTTPLIQNLKKRVPSCSISFVANKRTAPFLESNPNIDKVHIYERDFFADLARKSKVAYFQAFKRLLSEIRQQKYDCCIDLSLNGYTGFLMWLVGIPCRIGYNYKNRSSFLTIKVPLSGYDNAHVADYYLDLLKIFGLEPHPAPLQLAIADEDTIWADNFLKQSQISVDKPCIALLPGGGASWGKDAAYKQWPVENYAKIADKLIEKFSAQIILMGDKQDELLSRQILNQMTHSVVDVSGKTTIGQCAALLAQCRLAIMNDGGLLHIAVAVGTKTVSIFGPVDDIVYGPYPRDSHIVVTKHIPCRPCYRQFRRAQCAHIRCLTSLSVDDVLIPVSRELTDTRHRCSN